MKKTLLVVLLAALTATAYGTDYTLVPTTSAAAASSGYTGKGYTIDFASSPYSALRTDSQASSLYLTSFVVETKDTTATSLKLAVYKVTESKTSDLTWNNGNQGGWLELKTFDSLVGLSDVTTRNSTTGSIEFTFSAPLSLDIEDGFYAFMFVEPSATTASLTSNTGSTTLASHLYSNGSLNLSSLSVYSGPLSTSDHNYINTTSGSGKWTTTYTGPVATYTFSDTISQAIPEPATATLSLLALAGLAARRRRK